MTQFTTSHPFLGGLIKRTIKIVLTWNVVLACIFGTLVFFGLLSAVFAGVSGAATSRTPVYGDGINQILSIKISGVILGSSGAEGSLFNFLADSGQTYGYDIKEQLYAAADDELLKGVILEIDSPGGTIYGANAIADGVKYYREKTKKPVYAHVEGLGASAAYWAAASTDKIYVDYGSTTGSIGVIMGPVEFYDKVIATDGGLLGGGVITQNGIESTYFSAGKFKDLGNPYRRLTQEEVTILQQSVDSEYDEFVKFVSQRRNIPEATIRETIGAMAYEPKKAKSFKLADEIGSRQAAYEAIASSAKIGTDYTIVREQSEPGLADSLLGAVTRWQQPKAKPVDLCALTKSTLAYHGDVTAWCAKD